MRLPVLGSALLSLICPVLAHAATPPDADRAAILAMQGEYAVSVSGNWRLTFRFTSADASDVNLEDYH